MRIIDFADGFSSSGAPVTASSIYLANGARFGTNSTAAFTSECVTSYVIYASGASRASISSWLDVSTDTPMTHSSAAVGAFLRRIPQASVTDTAAAQAAGFFQVYINSGSGTYTNTSTASGISGIYVAALAPVGTMAITSYSGIFIAGDSTNTGTNKHGIKINDQTGATNNYAIYTGAGALSFGGALATRVQTVALTADNQVVTVTSSYIALTSDNATAANRTFVLTRPAEGQRLTLHWNDTDQGELVDDSANSGGGNVRLTSTWTPTSDDTLTLIGTAGGDWLEVSRSTN